MTTEEARQALREAEAIMREARDYFGHTPAEDGWEWSDGSKCYIGQHARGWLRRWAKQMEEAA